VWLQRGRLAIAIRASIALPGIFTSVMLNGRLMADGSVMDQIPVSPTAALDVDLTIGVSPGGSVRTRPPPRPLRSPRTRSSEEAQELGRAAPRPRSIDGLSGWGHCLVVAHENESEAGWVMRHHMHWVISASMGWRMLEAMPRELNRLDLAVYAAIAATPSPTLDRSFRQISRGADHSKVWLACAALLAFAGGGSGRRAAVNGLASTALTSAVVNLLLKPFGRRRRPDRSAHRVPISRHVTMPRSTSFPSGHSASAFAFATGVASVLPQAGIPLSAAASLVAYSRVHTGVHYPLDVIAGSVTGIALAPLAVAALERARARAS
jgi:undecaprenyl-diphosphatase